MSFLFWSMVFAASLAVLIKGAAVFTTGAKTIGTKLGVSRYIVGITIVSIGTSLPELMTSLAAVWQADGVDTTELVAANVVGSNIANVLVVVGLMALVCRRGINISRPLINIDLPLLVAATGLSLLLLVDGKFDWRDAALSLIGYLIYLAFVYSERPDGFRWFQRRQAVGWWPMLALVGGAVAMYVGADWTVRSVVAIAALTGVAQATIAIFVVALGTSLPELAVSLQAAWRGDNEIAIGNILGSNMFNLLVVLSVPAFLSTLTVAGSTVWLGLPFLVVSTMMFLISTIVPHVSRVEGAMYLLVYLAFLGKLFGWL